MHTRNAWAGSAGYPIIYALCALWASCTGAIQTSAGPDPEPGEDQEEGIDSGPPVVVTVDGEDLTCSGKQPGRAPLRRLTPFEYNNIVRDLLGDDSNPALALPADEVGNGFGNDADALSVSTLHAEKYALVAESVAAKAMQNSATVAKLLPCTAANEATCVPTQVRTFASRAFRRPINDSEAQELMGLFQKERAAAPMPVAFGAVIEAVLQSPDFLYRIERGQSEGPLRKPTSFEMASRLSFLFWGTAPDDALWAAANRDELTTPSAIKAAAERLVADPRAHHVVRYFFDNLLPISGVADLERDKAVYPTFNRAIGALMREETQQFLEHQIFEDGATWPQILTADHTYLNETLAGFYGGFSVKGTTFQKVATNSSRRKGLLTHPSIMAGLTHSITTSPVVRGSYVMQKILCQEIPLPAAEVLAKIKPPEPSSGPTARQRYEAHSKDPGCASCHRLMDPIGFALENYDPVGAYRTTENKVVIDPSTTNPLTGEPISGPIDLVTQVAAAPEATACLAGQWFSFAVGRSLSESEDDRCARGKLQKAFADVGFNVRALLVELSQTDSFLYLPENS